MRGVWGRLLGVVGALVAVIAAAMGAVLGLFLAVGWAWSRFSSEASASSPSLTADGGGRR